MTRMFRHPKGFGLVAISLALIAALLLGSVAPAKAELEEERVVKIGIPITLTGAVGMIGWVGLGFIDHMAHTNEQGAIDGVRIDCIWQDVGRAPIVQGISAHKRFVAAGEMLEFNYLLDTIEVIAPRLPEEETPILGFCPLSSLTLTKPIPWVFSSFPSGEDFGPIPSAWFIRNWAKERPARIGMIMYDQSPAWHALEGIKKLIEDYGANKAEFVGYEVVPLLGVLDTSVEWLRLAYQKPDFIFCAACGSTLNTLVKDCARLEILKKGIMVCDSGECIEDTVAAVGEAADGWYTMKAYRSALEDVDAADMPGLELLRKCAMKYRRLDEAGLRRYPIYRAGWMCGMIAAEAIRLAVEKVGVENLSGQAIRDGLASIEDLDMGGFMPPVTMSDSKPYYFDSAFIYRIQGGKLFLIEAGVPIPNTWFLAFSEE